MSTPRQHVTASGGSGAAPGPHAGSPHDPVPLWNIANILTVGRIALVPVFLVLLFVGDGHDIGWRLAATGVFAIAAITDRIDGQLARKHGLVTDFGKLADPIADKALIGAALVGLSMLGDLSWWVTGIIAARELGITALRFAVLRHAVIPASRGGKLKTLVQTLAIGVYLLPLPESVAPVAIGLMILAVALTVVTGLDYVVQAIRLRTGVRRSESETACAEDVPRVDVLGVDVAGVDVAGVDVAGEDVAGEDAAAQDTPGDGRTVGEDAR